MRTLVFLLACPLASGCLFLGAPSVQRTPEVAVGGDEVRAFQVTTEHVWGDGLARTHETTHFKEIPVTAATVESQQDATIAHCVCLLPLMTYTWSQSLEVLLYRPGYDTVTVAAWPWWCPLGYCHTASVHWRRVPDLHAQEEVLQGVIEKNHTSYLSLEPDMLRFAAEESERLAGCWGAATPEARDHRDRLLESAGQYRARAVELDQDRQEKLGRQSQPLPALPPVPAVVK